MSKAEQQADMDAASGTDEAEREKLQRCEHRKVIWHADGCGGVCRDCGEPRQPVLMPLPRQSD